MNRHWFFLTICTVLVGAAAAQEPARPVPPAPPVPPAMPAPPVPRPKPAPFRAFDFDMDAVNAQVDAANAKIDAFRYKFDADWLRDGALEKAEMALAFSGDAFGKLAKFAFAPQAALERLARGRDGV